MTATSPRVPLAPPPGTSLAGRLPELRHYVRASGLQEVVVGASRDPNAKITILLVSPRSGRAVLAVKAPTTDVAASAVGAEIRMLRVLGRLGSEPALDAVPKVVGQVAFEGRRAVVMTALGGTPMTTSYMRRRHTASRTRVEADFAAVATWLADFHQATAQGSGPLEMDGGVSALLRDRFGDDPGLVADLERLAGAHARLRAGAAAGTAVHGDLWLGNVLLDGGRVSGVVDWEAGRRHGQPLRDVVRFAHMYALYLGRRARPGRRVPGHRGLVAGRFGAGLEFALEGSGWFSEVYRHFLQSSLVRLGAPAAAWRDAALAGIAEVAAMTDDPQFARKNLELFRRVTRRRG